MFSHLFKKELLDNISSSRFLIIFVMCSSLVMLSLFIGTSDHNRATQQYHTSVVQMEETAKKQVTYQALGVWGMFKVYRPPSSLLPFAKGVEQASGNNSIVSIFQEPKLQDSHYSVEPIYAKFSELDFLFVIKVIIALLALMLTFDLINGEHENGTLKLMLSSPVPRTTIILSKIAGAFCSLVIPLLIPIIIGILAIYLVNDVNWGAEEWIRVSLILLSCILYISIFLVLGIFISCLVARPSNAFLILVLLWLSFVWVLPRISLFAATLYANIPAAYEIDQRKGEIDRQWYRDSTFKLNEWLQRHPEFDKVPLDVQGKINGALQKEAQRKKARIDELYIAYKVRRNDITHWLSRLSPSAAFENIVLSLARTDIKRQRKFIYEVKQYREGFQHYISEKMIAERKDKINGIEKNNAAGLDLSGMPELIFRESTIAHDINLLTVDFAVLFIYFLLVNLSSYFVFLRFKVV